MGLPPGAVQNALIKAGLDPEIINMDQDKSYASQVGEKSDGPLLKDDKEYTKYFKVSTLGYLQFRLTVFVIMDSLLPFFNSSCCLRCSKWLVDIRSFFMFL